MRVNTKTFCNLSKQTAEIKILWPWTLEVPQLSMGKSDFHSQKIKGHYFRAVQYVIIYEPFTRVAHLFIFVQLLCLLLMECTSPKRQKKQVQGNLKGRLKFNPSKVICHCQSLFLKLMHHYFQLPNLTDSNRGQLVWWKVSFCCKTKPYLTMSSCSVWYILRMYWFQTVLEQYI